MQDRPTAIELLEAAAQFIEREIIPVTEGAKQFQSRVAANVMRIVARELNLEEDQLRAEVAALQSLLGEDETPSSSVKDLKERAMNLGARLSERIRSGEADSGKWRSEVLATVRKIVEEKLRIANPRYLEADLAARAER